MTSSCFLREKKDKLNVVVYFYDKNKVFWDTFIGGVNIDLLHFPYDVEIQDWFPLSSFNDENKLITGKVLMKVCYRVGLVDDVPSVSIDGISSVYKKNWKLTNGMKEQLEKQRKMREKKGMKQSPLEEWDNEVVCIEN